MKKVRFKIDENLPVEFADILRASSYDAETVAGENLKGETDHKLSAVCKSERRVIISLDLDFSDITRYAPRKYPGFIVFRVGSHDKTHLIHHLKALIPVLDMEPIQNRLWIVDEDGIRIRE